MAIARLNAIEAEQSIRRSKAAAEQHSVDLSAMTNAELYRERFACLYDDNPYVASRLEQVEVEQIRRLRLEREAVAAHVDEQLGMAAIEAEQCIRRSKVDEVAESEVK